MKLLIAIPALNEEDSIRSIIEQTLAARDFIYQNSPVTDLEVTVVSDGSTDRTVEYATAYVPDIKLIVFPSNRGYGAAITEAWRQSDADLLSFLDADGTCDPHMFAALSRGLVEREADVALGNRLHTGTQMPWLRRLGNTFFALLLSVLSLSRVRDAASGMRVVRRTSLRSLFPLPPTLDFTPAMSARAVLSPDLRIIEIDMPYHERSGHSKLSPLGDGLRFLHSILRTAFLYRPSRPLGIVAGACFLLTLTMMAYPTWFYLRNAQLEEWMIYRFLVAELLTSLGVLLVCAGHLGSKAASISLSESPDTRPRSFLERVFASPWFWCIPIVMVVGGGIFVWDAWQEYWSTGKVYEHWSRFVGMMLLLSVTAVLIATRIIDYSLDLLEQRLHYLRHADSTAAGRPAADG